MKKFGPHCFSLSDAFINGAAKGVFEQAAKYFVNGNLTINNIEFQMVHDSFIHAQCF